tara:strand:+ start:1531 stop:6426 length:4896 start_codon:yes stop_codon:yes gene_type:complete
MLKKFYPSLKEAKQATQALCICSLNEYRYRYKEDPFLPAHPERTYSDEWPLKNGFAIFFGNTVEYFYPTLAEAKQATLLLGINSMNDYNYRYREDPRLPSAPARYYSKEWSLENSVNNFFDKTINFFYSTLKEAVDAVQVLGINSMEEYSIRYREDQRLPLHPDRHYSKEWPLKNGFTLFFGRTTKVFYSTLKEALHAVQVLGINSMGEYRNRYLEDPLLPANPAQYYSKEWPSKHGYLLFLGKLNKDFYPTLLEAKLSTQALEIYCLKEYMRRYKEDPRLPKNPIDYYSDELSLESNFLFFNDNSAQGFYPTLAKAQKATLALGVRSKAEYNRLYRKDPRLPSNPDQYYVKEWPLKNGFAFFLGELIENFYPTLSEAILSIQALEIYSINEYSFRYHEDHRLPENPIDYYSDELALKKNFSFFNKNSPKVYYPTLAQAKIATLALRIRSRSEYNLFYRRDPRLPAHPERYYVKEWPSKNGFLFFFNKAINNFYPTLAKAQKAILALGINSMDEYRYQFKNDPRLPANPERHYAKEWPLENGFLLLFGKPIKDYYPTLEEAKRAIELLNIHSTSEYYLRYKEDPRLPSNPEKYYSKEWPLKNGFYFFFGIPIKEFYPTLAEALKGIEALEINSMGEYRSRFREDPRLPSKLSDVYASEWGKINDISNIFGVKKFYLTLEEVKKAINILGIMSFIEYSQRYKEDPLLPSRPKKMFSKEWTTIDDTIKFFIPDKITCYDILAKVVKALNIKDSVEYREKRKEFSQLPSQPKRSFPNDFLDWYQLCGIPKPYPYVELQRLVQKANLRNQDEYNKWRIESKDPRIPSDPNEKNLYRNDWVNWYIFLGEEEPFQPKYFRKPYLEWRDSVIEFMKIARGGSSKKLYLCKFVRLYVQKHELGVTPLDFVINKNISIANFKEFLTTEKYHIKIYNAIDEFIDYILRVKCTDEDPDTGEVVRMKDAKNRIKGIWVPEGESRSKPDETVKPALSYQYVQALRSWTIPSDAKTFSDLVHLQTFDCEWITVPISTIDVEDPDCVYKIVDDELAKIWIPIYWMHAYALFSVPLRGMQIAYNDSGEADNYLPEYENGKVIWKENKGELAGLTKSQGMIKRYSKGEFGMFSTSNKTSTNLGTQSVPWMPEELAYWLIKLRKWQSKYNPITAPKAWLDCEHTNLNETQRKQKGVNCFLFRDFGEEECGTFGGRLANRLAVALYYSQPKGIQLATCNGSLNAISRYKSEYTPHSMRVSLITIYVMEYNLDLSIIMKLAGHSSIVMSVYYVKIQGVALRKKIEEGEKRALKDQAKATQSMIEQLRIDEIKANLVGNSEATLKAINNNTPVGNFLFRDWGICPHAGTRCEDGGELIGNTQARSPTPNGYLGGENCIRCRHFITGPAFIGGLLAIFQEIILHLEAKQSHYDELIADESELLIKLEKEDEKEYLCNKKDIKFDSAKREEILAYKRKTKSEYEVVAKKMDVLYCDLGAVSTLVHQCQALLNQTNFHINSDKENLQLIVRSDHELQVIAEEVSQYELLCEVCENAEIYQSASAELAITPRSQLLDTMMLRNNLDPKLFMMTPKQQLKAGNQLNRLFKERLKSHTRVNDLIDGKILLNDLSENERIEPIDLVNVLNQEKIEIKEL